MMASAPPADFAAAVLAASRQLATDPPGAERAARVLIGAAPHDPRPRLILGSALRRQGNAAGALAVLQPLSAAYPGAATTLFEFGVTLAALGDKTGAIKALRRAVEVNRQLPDAWKALGDLLFEAGETSGAERAFAELERASVREPALAAAAEAIFEGRRDLADSLLSTHLAAVPADAEALHMLARLRLGTDRNADAEVLLRRCLALDPRADGARFDLATAFFRQQKAQEALAEADRLITMDPGETAYLNLRAGCLSLVGDYTAALAIYEVLLKRLDRQPRLWLNYGHALRTLGRRDEAIAAYKTAVALAPAMGEAYWSLANLKVAAFSAEDEAAMAGQLTSGVLTDEDRLHLHYALAKALEDRGDNRAAFEAYERGARLRRQVLDYDAQANRAMARRTMALFTSEFLAARTTVGAEAPDPVFIVGLPRSGSTLVEQILASHSMVEGTMELPDVTLMADRIARETRDGYPEALASLPADAWRELGEAYLARTRVHRKLGRPFFIDKMPNNFAHVGMIHLSLPRARIIDVRRHPLAAGFSAFKQYFARGQAFSYDLGDIGAYYRDYVDLMAHFDAVLPGRIHRIIYEDIVESTEAQVRLLLAYCGLPFEPACLEFHRTDRAVRTVSSEQVRRPIFREGLDHWRGFEPWLGPMKATLGPALEAWRC